MFHFIRKTFIYLGPFLWCMRYDPIYETFFWKQLMDTFLEEFNINKEEFYEKIMHLRSVWELTNDYENTEEIKKAADGKVLFIKECFKEVIREYKPRISL